MTGFKMQRLDAATLLGGALASAAPLFQAALADSVIVGTLRRQWVRRPMTFKETFQVEARADPWEH
jgi:hypothetical protein